MPGLLSPTVDLSRLPAPQAVVVPDFEVLREARLADLGLRWPEFTALLESDPAVKLTETGAYRELIVMARINDAVRAGMLAFAAGSDLDHIAAFYDVARKVIVPATARDPAVLESDTEFRRRVLLAPESFAGAGTAGGWLFHALSADPRVLDAEVWSPSPGEVTVAIQSREGDGEAADDLLDACRAWLSQDRIKPLTDALTVRSVTNVPYAISVEAFVRPGPSPLLLRDEIAASLAAMAAARRTPGRDVPRSAVFAAASLEAVDKVLVQEPAEDIARDHGEVGLCTAIDVTVSAHDG